MRWRQAKLSAWAVLSCACWLGAPAHASEGQWALSLGAGPAWLQRSGWGAQGALRLGYGVGDYVELDLQALGFVSPAPPERQTLQAVALGGAYRLDVIQWVPHLGARAGWSSLPGVDGREQAPLAAVSYGLDRLLSRSWAVGAVVEHTLLLPEAAVLWLHGARLVASFRFEP